MKQAVSRRVAARFSLQGPEIVATACTSLTAPGEVATFLVWGSRCRLQQIDGWIVNFVSYVLHKVSKVLERGNS